MSSCHSVIFYSGYAHHTKQATR